MIRIVLVAFAGLVVASSAAAQTTAEIVEQALTPAPDRLTLEPTVKRLTAWRHVYQSRPQ